MSAFRPALGDTVRGLLENIHGKFLAPDGLKVRWFDSWQPALDEALASLPETDACPHELYRILVQNPSPARKRVALVTQRGTPVAVVGLRQTGRHSWDPITKWIVPGLVFPVKPGFEMAVLESLGIEVSVAWWRMESPPPSSKQIRSITRVPTHRLSCSVNFETYWRETGYHRTIVNARNRCRDFTFGVNPEGGTDWTITNCERKWRNESNSVDPALPDRIVAAHYMVSRKRAYTLALLDKETLIAAGVCLVHGSTLAAWQIYRDAEYNRFNTGIRLIELICSFAKEARFSEFDLGGGYEYKAKWAPEAGERYSFQMCPEIIVAARKFLSRIQKKDSSAPSKPVLEPPVD